MLKVRNAGVDCAFLRGFFNVGSIFYPPAPELDLDLNRDAYKTVQRAWHNVGRHIRAAMDEMPEYSESARKR